MMQDVGPMEQVAPMIGMCFIGFMALAFSAIHVIVFCMIYLRAGYPWAMGLLMLIPVVNFIMMLILAFSEWPIQKQLRQFQKMAPQAGAQQGNIQNL
jgi:hypothetical protein